MKNEVQRLMSERDVDAIWVTGAGQHNPFMVYLTGAGHVTNADVVIAKGAEPVIFCGAMEREEALKSGFAVKLYDEFPLKQYLKQANNDEGIAMANRLAAMFQNVGLHQGGILLYGEKELNTFLPLVDTFRTLYPQYRLITNKKSNVLQRAMLIKDLREIDHIKQVGEGTVEVVSRVEDFLSRCREKEGILLDSNDHPVTIGMVKRKIDLWLNEVGLENPEGVIFSIGRDAGIPHSAGNPEDFIRTGETIVFDIFPCERGGGYYHDFTRTWCVGHAPEHIQAAYDQVKDAYQRVVKALTINTPFRDSQRLTCEIFQEMGHPTIENTPGTQEGYVHSVGHGIGMHVHESPFCGMTAGEDDILQSGAVFTIEPGLYYPSKGFGIRLEDTFVAMNDGSFETLIDYPMELVIHLKS
jgi:Xaa-Pro aminopeptidase